MNGGNLIEDQNHYCALVANEHFYEPMNNSLLFCMVLNYQCIADTPIGRPMATICAVVSNEPTDRYKSFGRTGTIIVWSLIILAIRRKPYLMLTIIDPPWVQVTGSVCTPMASRGRTCIESTTCSRQITQNVLLLPALLGLMLESYSFCAFSRGGGFTVSMDILRQSSNSEVAKTNTYLHSDLG
ncbi:hypothetical protein EV421DRAFT_611867 [Armillaria borealis]|uniref:Uncharacterized protein n=1 Tax=Armillaria borealis TaxID=47425 RepID=A0AA39JFN1_9AGAR|nr:hypothetical protein EV421DRAFT_611867 [Armillaria borealis]